MQVYQDGTKVKWKSGNGFGHGEVRSSFTTKVTRKIAGEAVTRHGSSGNPAYDVHVEDGNKRAGTAQRT